MIVAERSELSSQVEVFFPTRLTYTNKKRAITRLAFGRPACFVLSVLVVLFGCIVTHWFSIQQSNHLNRMWKERTKLQQQIMAIRSELEERLSSSAQKPLPPHLIPTPVTVQTSPTKVHPTLLGGRGNWSINDAP